MGFSILKGFGGEEEPEEEPQRQEEDTGAFFGI